MKDLLGGWEIDVDVEWKGQGSAGASRYATRTATTINRLRLLSHADAFVAELQLEVVPKAPCSVISEKVLAVLFRPTHAPQIAGLPLDEP